MILYCNPYRADGNLAKAYNEIMERLQPGDWACFMDLDTLATPHEDFGEVIDGYIVKYPECKFFTCLTNRIGAKEQLAGVDQDRNNIRYHRYTGELLREEKYRVKETKNLISGVMMLIKKDIWEPVKYEGMKGVDNHIVRLLRRKTPIYIMQGVYLYHWYGWTPKGRKTDHLK